MPIMVKQALDDLTALSEGVLVFGFTEAMRAGMKWERVSNPPSLLTNKASRYFGPLT
jgi:hypothetical protein